MNFFKSLSEAISKKGNHICIGVDPHQHGLSSFIEREFSVRPLETLERFCESLINVAAAKVSCLKFQSAFFEAFGADGMRCLQRSIATAKSKGLLVILDNKRGDISSTMSAYGFATFELLQADAMTVTPYMGVDCLSPLETYCKQGKGIYVVWRTSNPNAAILQDCLLADGTPFYLHVLRNVLSYGESHGIADSLGFVLGATHCSELPDALLIKLSEMTKGRWLIPGFGAQKAEVTDKTRQLTKLKQHVVPLSRGIYNSPEEMTSWQSFEQICTANLMRAIDSLGQF